MDVRFRGCLPSLYHELATEPERCVIEVRAHLDDHTVRGIALTPTEGLCRGTSAELLRRLQPMTGNVKLVFHRSRHGLHEPCLENLWPVEETWLSGLRARSWRAPGQRGGLPLCWGSPDQTLAWLLEKHIYLACQQTMAHSLAGENHARMMTMQSAEKNLEKMRSGLQDSLQGRRQNAVTEELLDLVSGFEMLSLKDG